MKKEGILGIVLMLLFLVLPVASAHVEIIDMGHYYDGIDRLGYVDYRNAANYTVEGAILVFIDGDIVAAKMLNMDLRYVAGFRCSPVKPLEFALCEIEGDHTIAVCILSMNSSVERTYEYFAEGWWNDQEDEIESELEEEEEEWLECWMYRR